MPRARALSLALFLASALLALLPAADAAAQGGGRTFFSASGVLLDAAGAPVPCCDVLVVVRVPGDPNAFSQALARTRGDGSYTATGLLCDPGLNLEVLAESQCCDGASAPRDISGCLDPDTGGPLETVQLGDIVCADDPVTNRSLLTGRAVCRDGLFLEPVADCGILASQEGSVAGAFTWTDDDGLWELCVDCNPSAPPLSYEVEAQCCGLLETVDIPDCPERRAVDTFVCDPCPDPPCEEPREVQVSGRVICPDASGGPGEPIEGCTVEVRAFDNCMSGPPAVEVVTDADGNWTACLPCPLGQDCANGASWNVQAFPQCCPNGFQSLTVEGCPPAVEMPDNACPPDPLGTGCALEDACRTGETRVSGALTCRDPAGGLVPIPDCPVTALCPGGVPVTAVTDANGRYELCFPCGGCDNAQVFAECCDAQTTIDLLGCPSQVTADLSCVDCPPPPRPCPPPDSVQVTGFVGCAQQGAVTPLAGCEVILEPRDVTGMPLDPVTTQTGGDGSYSACVPCTDDGLALITATAPCCGLVEDLPVDGCPETLEAPAMLCDDCSPCPPGMTRLQGRVHCRGGGGVADCRVRITVPTCDGDEVFFATTDSEGKYRLCVPCPCDGEVVRVESECCNGSTRRQIDECGPITPMRTIFCGSCP